MDNTVSVSKGCFVFKPKHEEKKGKRKKYNDILDFSSSYWYGPYTAVWSKITKKLEEFNSNIADVVLHGLESFISDCKTSQNTIHTAVILMGVNLPDHDALFLSLSSRLQKTITPYVALLDSNSCTTVKYAIEQMVSQFLKHTKILDEKEMMDIDYDSEEDEEDDQLNLRRLDCTLPRLLEWYNEDVTNEDDTRTKLVIILKDFEGFSSSVLEDFILILSQYSSQIPFVLVMGVATTASALHRTLPHNVTSQLSIRIFQSKPSVYFLNNTLDNVFLNEDCPFQFGTKILKFLRDVFLYYDFSVDGFVKGIKFCVMEHFRNSPTSVLCCSQSMLDKTINSLPEEYLKAIKSLPSFQSYYKKLSKQKQSEINSNTNAVKELLKKLMKDLWEHMASFHCFIRLLQIMVADLPNAPLGKQVREIYTEAVSNKITNNPSYQECFKILGFTAKEELLNKLTKMMEYLEDMPKKNSVVKSIEKKLKELVKDVEKSGFDPLPRTPTKSPRKESFNVNSRAQFRQHLEKMSQCQNPKNAFEAARKNVLDYLKDEAFDKTLLPFTALPLHEVILLDDLSSIKRHIIGTPRAAMHVALNNPHHYLQCKCCQMSNSNGSEIIPTMPDICIAYKLHLESGSLINMYDWLQSFTMIVDPEHYNREQKDVDSHIQARFTQAVAELQFLGFIKSSKKKTDHVTRLTWGGSV